MLATDSFTPCISYTCDTWYIMNTRKSEPSVFQKGLKVTPGGRCISAKVRKNFDVLLESSKKTYYDDYLANTSPSKMSTIGRESQSSESSASG